MSKCSQKMIDSCEAAILSDKLMPKDYDNLPAISYSDYKSTKVGWKFINEADKNYYMQFASNASGFTSYGFYKANDGKIYIIEAYINEISRIYTPTKMWCGLEELVKDDE